MGFNMLAKWRNITTGRAMLASLVLLIGSCSAFADSLADQRLRYQQVKTAWDNKQMDDVARLLPTLKSYPLYPYLEYRAITQDLSLLNKKQVDQFVKQHPTLPLSHTLVNHFINELAQRNDWQGLLRFVKTPPKIVISRCNYYYAKWITGNKQEAYEATPSIWLSGRSLPNECDKLFNVWQNAGKQTPELTIERIRLANDAGKNGAGMVAYLVKQLPPSYKQLGDDIIKLHAKPSSLADFAKTHKPTELTRELVLVIFSKLVRQDLESARVMIPTLVKDQKMSVQERLDMEKTIAWRLMGNGTSASLANWRDGVIARSHDVSLIERRVRLALGRGNDKDLAKWLILLPEKAQEKEEWRYWQADLLLKQGKRKEGERILHQLMEKRGFYPMVAAQRLNKRYPIKVNKAARPDPSLDSHPVVKRVKELIYWNLENQARSEWINLVASSPKTEQESLARYAFEKRWADLSVQATITAKLWDHLEERFPPAYGKYFTQALKGKGISRTYAMAIARQESGWNYQAQSPVGARGLMQLMPQTAKETAKKANMTNYKNVSQLFDPETNIQLGTTYLNGVYQSFDNNRILASAAYNAGPHRVNIWLSNSGGYLNPIAFIESIPFTETRGYVKNVLSYDVFFSHFISKQNNILTDSEWKLRY